MILKQFLDYFVRYQTSMMSAVSEGVEKLTTFVDKQYSAKRQAIGLVNFVLAVSYHFCLRLPAAFTQPGDRL